MPRRTAAVLLGLDRAATLAVARSARGASDEDLALLRVTAAAELTLASYHARATASARLTPAERRWAEAWRKGCALRGPSTTRPQPWR